MNHHTPKTPTDSHTHAHAAHTLTRPGTVPRFVFDQRSQVFVTTDEKRRRGVSTEAEECVE